MTVRHCGASTLPDVLECITEGVFDVTERPVTRKNLQLNCSAFQMLNLTRGRCAVRGVASGSVHDDDALCRRKQVPCVKLPFEKVARLLQMTGIQLTRHDVQPISQDALHEMRQRHQRKSE